MACAVLIAAEPLLERLRAGGGASSLSYKMEIWRQTLSQARQFLVFGAGPGSFVRVFNHYKEAHGDGTFWHAENDYIELILELGFPLALLAFGGLILAAARIRRESSRDAAGILAALAAFGIHASGEFVSHIPANLILASALLGTAAARWTPARSAEIHKPGRRRLYPFIRLMGPPVFLAASLLQFTAAFHSWRTNRALTPTEAAKSLDRSLALWPFAVDRQIGRLRMASNKDSAEVLRTMGRALHLDPLNWSLRLEQAWFELAYSTNQARALAHAQLCVRLNPLQGQIPLRFARHFALSDPDLALQFLSLVHPSIPATHRAALDLAWNITRDPAQVWKLTPNTVPTLLNLVHFAVESRLAGLAAEACQALEGRVPATDLAALLLSVEQPGRALRVLAQDDSLRGRRFRIQSLHDLKRYPEAIAEAELLFGDSRFDEALRNHIDITASFSQLLSNHQAAPSDPVAALMLAEKIAVMAPVNRSLLKDLAEKFPTEPRIAFLFFSSFAKLEDPAAASTAGVSLASRLAP